MASHSKTSLVVLIALGVLWYLNLVALIVSMTDYPGSEHVRDHQLIIGIILLFTSGCFLQSYAMRKKDSALEDE